MCAVRRLAINGRRRMNSPNRTSELHICATLEGNIEKLKIQKVFICGSKIESCVLWIDLCWVEHERDRYPASFSCYFYYWLSVEFQFLFSNACAHLNFKWQSASHNAQRTLYPQPIESDTFDDRIRFRHPTSPSNEHSLKMCHPASHRVENDTNETCFHFESGVLWSSTASTAVGKNVLFRYHNDEDLFDRNVEKKFRLGNFNGPFDSVR